MESMNNNTNHMFLSELKELRNELSAVKKRIVQLEESHEKQQERINILEIENHTLKMKKGLNEEGESVLKRKRTEKDQDPEEETESKSTSALASVGKKKTKTENNYKDEAVVILRRDNGDSFDSLSDDLLHKIVEFDGNCYSKFGSINKRCRNIYDVKEYKLKKQTCLYGYGTVDMMLQHYLQKRREETLDSGERCHIAEAVTRYNRLDAIDWMTQLGDSELLQLVCSFASDFGRINILSKVFLNCNLTMLDNFLEDLSLCYSATINGKLETLKWLRKYGVKWSEDTFIAASVKGYAEIVQYLHDEGCPEPSYEERDESSENEQLSSDDEDGDY